MVRRRGIGASIAAAFVFSTILLSNFALLASAGQREQLSIEANSESLLGDNGIVLAGSEALGILGSLQSRLASNPLPCAGTLGDVTRSMGELNDTSSQDGVTVREWGSVGGEAGPPDNLSILRPFNGPSPGGINLALGILWVGTSRLGDVVVTKTEHHQLNLPVRLDQMSKLCASSVEEIGSLLAGQVFPSCNASAIGPSVEALAGVIRSSASKQGLGFLFHFETTDSVGCSVSFECQIEQSGVPGPDGTFSVRLEQDSTQPVQTALWQAT